MGNFTRSFTETFTFDGDEIVVTLTNFLRKDMLEMAPLMSLSAKPPGDADERKQWDSDQAELINMTANVLPNYITDMRGLIVEGTEVKVGGAVFNEVMTASYFIPLLAEIIGTLMEHSSVGEKTEKKSDALPVAISRDSTAIPISKSAG